MKATQVEGYLRRLGYDGPRRPSVQSLRRLHLAHMRRVPFENLDIHLGREIVLEEEALYRKIVEDGRGGFCYELNGLFASLLGALGFGVQLLSARVIGRDGNAGPEFDHLTLLAEAGGHRRLADVGFGDSFQEPLRLQSGSMQSQASGSYRLDEADAQWTLLESSRSGEDEEWRAAYTFTVEPRCLAQFGDMCRHHQVSAESPFTGNRMCTRATPEGRLTLSGMRLRETTEGGRKETELRSEAEFWQVADERFAIRVPRASPGRQRR